MSGIISELILFWPQLISVSFIAIFMAVSPGADFVMITRNSIFYGRSAGLYGALGVSLAIWIHVAYSIAGLAIIIANSIILFTVIKYLGAAYLIYIGWKTFRSRAPLVVDGEATERHLTPMAAFRSGFITNALNPKTTIFFLSLFTQVVDPQTPLFIQIIYGAIISLAHCVWFSLVALFLSQPVLLAKFRQYQSAIEKLVGGVLMAFGVKVAVSSQV